MNDDDIDAFIHPGVGRDVGRGQGGTRVIDLQGYDPVEHNLFGLDIYSQEEWWKPADGQRVRLVDMMPTHRANLLRWLERNARAIEFNDSLAYLAGPFTAGGDMAMDAESDWLDQKGEDPVAWMKGTKLYRRLAVLVEQDRQAMTSGKDWFDE